MQSGRIISTLFLGILVAAVALTAAAGTGESSAPPVNSGEVDADRLGRNGAGLVVLNGTPFTGVLVKREGGSVLERSAYQAGLRSGITERWFDDGTLSYRATYLAGRRDGTVESWWGDGVRRSEANYTSGVAHGVQREWFRSGVLFKELHLVEGREQGLQRAWRENGALYTNYEARDGRIFGLKRATLCYELDDEQIVLAD